MGYFLNSVQANEIIAALKKEYHIFAPRRYEKAGRYSDTDIIRYGEVDAVEDIVFHAKSDFSAKEVITPIQETLFYFTEDEWRASKGPDKKILVFSRPCDINSQRIRDRIFLQNGNFADLYYDRVQSMIKYVWMDCGQGADPTRDIPYKDNGEVGERRRVEASCQIDDFTKVAGGGSYCNTAGDRMRFKVLRKFHNYKARFPEEQMCVGCGRCIQRCPQAISIIATVEK